MSYDSCKYCTGYAYKTDGNGDFICLDRANTGTCSDNDTPTEAQLKAYERDSFDTGKTVRTVRRADNRKSKGKRKYGYK